MYKSFLILLALILGVSTFFVGKNLISNEKLMSNEKINLFEKELDYIQNNEVKDITKNLIGQLPDYYFEIPASSTGKHHPNYAQGKGGLVRHTQAAVRIAIELLRLEMYEDLQKDKDLIIAALILHDGLKNGEEYSEHTKSEHPILASNFIKNNTENQGIANKIADLVLTHMGQWNTEYKSTKEIMPKPTTKAQKFVHLCDYLASRKALEYNFDVHTKE